MHVVTGVSVRVGGWVALGGRIGCRCRCRYNKDGIGVGCMF